MYSLFSIIFRGIFFPDFFVLPPYIIYTHFREVIKFLDKKFIDKKAVLKNTAFLFIKTPLQFYRGVVHSIESMLSESGFRPL